jgi:hypothetical protein
LHQPPFSVEDIRRKASQLGLKADYDEIIARVRASPEHGEMI